MSRGDKSHNFCPLWGGRGAQWARRPSNEKLKIKNEALKNSGRIPKTQATDQVRYNSKLFSCTAKKDNFQNMFFWIDGNTI